MYNTDMRKNSRWMSINIDITYVFFVHCKYTLHQPMSINVFVLEIHLGCWDWHSMDMEGRTNSDKCVAQFTQFTQLKQR